jgi:hypothetical protein
MTESKSPLLTTMTKERVKPKPQLDMKNKTTRINHMSNSGSRESGERSNIKSTDIYQRSSRRVVK